MGISIWSPRLDSIGNSVRGIEFCTEIIEKYNFHNYDSLVSARLEKKDPRQRKHEKEDQSALEMCWASCRGDLESLQHMVARGSDISCADYDGRTPMHLAAAEGHLDVVKYLYAKGADIQSKDRWGREPLDDASRNKHRDIEDYINKIIKKISIKALRGSLAKKDALPCEL